MVVEGLLFAAFGLLFIVFRRACAENIVGWNRDVWRFPQRTVADKELTTVIVTIVGSLFLCLGIATALGLLQTS